MSVDENFIDFSDNIARLLQSGSPFFVYCLPGGRCQLADPSSVNLVPWPGSGPEMKLCRKSTSWPDYRNSLVALIDRLHRRGGKTVISRVICGRLQDDVVSMAFEFFKAYPQSYRTFFYTAHTGGWLGASPELLYKVEKNRLYTMALAGTRKISRMPWDRKNAEEHRMVADFIEEILKSQQASYKRFPRRSLHYGAIEHLLTEFTADVSTVDLALFRDSMQPTPAVGGYPRPDAMADIARFEEHPRNLYSGLIEFTDASSGNRYCIVNLRCMQFIGDECCIYAGGGITAESDPLAEWAETESKSAWLCAHIKK